MMFMFLTFLFVIHFSFSLWQLSRAQIVHDAESGFPPKGVSGSPPTGPITARHKYLGRAPIQQ